MSQDWIAYFAATPWAPVAAAFVFGVATGWLIWGARRADVEVDPAERVRAKAARLKVDSDEDFETPPATRVVLNGDLEAGGADEARIARIEREIAEAKALLAATAKDGERFEEDLEGVEQSVARANGRLKLMARTVRRVAGLAEER